MRTLSLNARRAIFSQTSGEVFVFLLTITHPLLAEARRISTDATVRLSTDPLTYGTTSRGEDYLYVGARITLPDEKDRQAPRCKLTISNLDRELIPVLRSTSTPANLKLEGVMASAPDDVETEIPAIQIVHVDGTSAELTFDLAVDARVTEPHPADSFDPSNAPGLF